MNFEGKTIIVTGSARGIGKIIAESFAKLGGNIVLVDIIEDELEKTADEFNKQFQGKTIYLVTDISNSQSVDNMVARIKEEFGRIDVLINNAGITKDTLLLRMKEPNWDQVLDVNLKGTFLCTQKCLRMMLKKKYGKIVNISSIIGIMGNVGQANYAASKAGIIGFTKSVAKEVAAKNINVNAIAPGFIETEMTKQLPEKVIESYMTKIPMRKFGKPLDVAKLAIFLASEESNYITGQVIVIDGGML